MIGAAAVAPLFAVTCTKHEAIDAHVIVRQKRSTNSVVTVVGHRSCCESGGLPAKKVQRNREWQETQRGATAALVAAPV
jgi:hypothetical protein